ncbi:MAG: phage terminase large subunit [Bacteroidales bacterium]
MTKVKLNIISPALTYYQKAIVDSIARYTVCEASTKVGKTFSHIYWLFRESHLGKRGYNYWWVAPIFSQTEIAFKRMCSRVVGNSYYIINQSKLTITTPIGTIIAFKSADNPDSLYGEDVYAVVFDEFSRAKEAAWHALRTTITHTQAKCKFIGNVVGKNWAYKLAMNARSGLDKDFEYHKVTCYDAVKAGILKQEEIDSAKKELPSRVFKMLYEADITEIEGALWTCELIDSFRKINHPTLSRVVIGVDPAVTSSKESDETGLIVAGKGVDNHYYVIEDISGTYSPDGWGRKVVNAWHDHKLDRAVAEVNQGGDLVESNIRNIDRNVIVKKVHATRGKVLRAEPIVGLYERGEVHHVGKLEGLEDQMTSWDAKKNSSSPDRVDALVWALTELSQGANFKTAKFNF